MFRIRLADKIIRIYNHDPYVQQLCRYYLTGPEDQGIEEADNRNAFRENKDSDLRICVPSEAIHKEHMCSPQLTFGYCESICICREICRKLLPYRIFLLHAAVISFDGEGYAFAGPSGIGKTTHIKLWKQAFGERVCIINGDKPFIAYDESRDCFIAYGTPWCGKENLGCSSSVPLKSICFLKQGAENKIKEAGPKEILGQLFQQVLLPEEEELLDIQLELLDMLTTRVSFYKMTCNMSLEAAQTACGAMRGKSETVFNKETHR